MNILYFLLMPLAFFVLNKKARAVVLSRIDGNYSKLKADIFFLCLTVIVCVGIVFVVETV